MHKDLENLWLPYTQMKGIKLPLKAKKTQDRNALKPKTIKNIVPIYSTKGGVGKSTMTHQIARFAAKHGLKVGILDADIYGPNQTDLFDHYQGPEVDDGFFIPVLQHNVHWMSIGILTEDRNAPVIWRGPMASRALKQMLTQTKWPELDYLFIDLPPGTGDIQLTLMKEIAISSSIIISTPSILSYKDAAKGVLMMNKLNVSVDGWIDNMAFLSCPKCDCQINLAQTHAPDSLKAIKTQHQMPLLGPDAQTEEFEIHLKSFIFNFFLEISKKLDDRSSKIPKIIVQ